MQSNLRVALLRQISDDALADEVRRADDVQYFVVVLAQQGELEAVLGGIDRQGLCLGVTVEAVDVASLDASQVHGLLQSLDDAAVALRQSVLDVIQGRVHKDAAVVPGTRLDADGLMDQSTLGKSLGGQDNGWQEGLSASRTCSMSVVGLTVLAQESNMSTIIAPDGVLDGWGRQLVQDLLLLNVKENDAGGRAEKQTGGTTVKDVVGGRGAAQGLGHAVVEIADLNHLRGVVEDSESVASHKESCFAGAALARSLSGSFAIFGQVDHLVDATFGGGSNDDSPLGRVVGDCPRLNELRPQATDRQH